MFYATSRIASDFTKYEQGNVTYAMRANYPGDDYVDAIGFDCYDNLTFYPGDTRAHTQTLCLPHSYTYFHECAESLNATCTDIFAFAEEKGKIPVGPGNKRVIRKAPSNLLRNIYPKVIGETGHTLGMSCEHCGHWFDEFLGVYNDPYSLCNKVWMWYGFYVR